MTPKEKAQQIFITFQYIPHKFKEEKRMKNYDAKFCAIVSVENTIQVLRYFNEENAFRDDMKKSYWIKVKKELEKL